MRAWMADRIARMIPTDIRRDILLEELAKTPRSNLNAMATSLEEVLRHMTRRSEDMEMVQRYKTVPEFVEAIPITAATIEIAANWCGGTKVREIDPLNQAITYVGLNVPTLMGVQRASEGDYVVRTADGQFTVYQQTQFRDKFKPIRS